MNVSALSISAFLDDTIDEISARIAADLHDLTQGTNAERMATLTLLLEGAPSPRLRRKPGWDTSSTVTTQRP